MNKHLELKNRLKEFRKARKLTQTELADLAGTTKNTISAIETGQFAPSAYLAAVIARILKCKFEDVFYLAVEEEKDEKRTTTILRKKKMLSGSKKDWSNGRNDQ